MKITCHEVEHPWISIEDFYDQKELDFIWEELNFVSYPWKMLTPDGTNSAKVDGIPIKKNLGLFLDNLYKDRIYSNVLTANRKLLMCEQGRNKGKLTILQNHNNWFFKYFRLVDEASLLSYYENEDHYKPHEDMASITALTWLYKEPKKFTGGDLVFPITNETIECKNNKMVIFPSCVTHQVTTVKMDKEYEGKRLGRWCISQFLHGVKTEKVVVVPPPPPVIEKR